jgi:GR25 family glycosyltransferase involved in LPS biosynthesis
VEDSYAFTTHAYLLSAEGAERFFRALPDPTDAPIDWMVLRLKALGTLSVYTASPRLFRQDRVECPGLIHQEDEPPEFWPLGKPLPWEYPNAS